MTNHDFTEEELRHLEEVYGEIFPTEQIHANSFRVIDRPYDSVRRSCVVLTTGFLEARPKDALYLLVNGELVSHMGRIHRAKNLGIHNHISNKSLWGYGGEAVTFEELSEFAASKGYVVVVNGLEMVRNGIIGSANVMRKIEVV